MQRRWIGVSVLVAFVGFAPTQAGCATSSEPEVRGRGATSADDGHGTILQEIAAQPNQWAYGNYDINVDSTLQPVCGKPYSLAVTVQFGEMTADSWEVKNVFVTYAPRDGQTIVPLTLEVSSLKDDANNLVKPWQVRAHGPGEAGDAFPVGKVFRIDPSDPHLLVELLSTASPSAGGGSTGSTGLEANAANGSDAIGGVLCNYPVNLLLYPPGRAPSL